MEYCRDCRELDTSKRDGSKYYCSAMGIWVYPDETVCHTYYREDPYRTDSEKYYL